MPNIRLTRRSFLAASAGVAGILAMPRTASAAPSEAFPEAKFVETNGIRMAVHEQGTGFPVVFCHGFPELGYSWRHQLPALAKAGFRAIAPDQRGYGGTDQPKEISAYSIQHLCGDLAGMLDALEIEKAVFCGHDWGGFIVWMMPLLYPDRVAGVIGVNTAFSPRPPAPPLKMLEAAMGKDMYIVAFQEPGVADAALAKDVRKTFAVLMRTGGRITDPAEFAKLPPDSPERRFELLKWLERPEAPDGHLVLSDEALEHYVTTYTRTGFTGGINWYRNIDRNWETTKDLVYKIDKPCLYVGAANDVVLPPSSANGMEARCPDLEKKTIADCGHWTQQEKPDELNAILVDWLGRKFA